MAKKINKRTFLKELLGTSASLAAFGSVTPLLSSCTNDKNPYDAYTPPIQIYQYRAIPKRGIKVYK